MTEHTIASAVITSMKVHKRKPADFYPTPPDVTVALMRWLDLNPEAVVWEPACGDGAMASVISRFAGEVWSSDLREDGGYGRGGVDFLNCILGDTFSTPPDWIITNPPFNVAEKFIEHALGITPNVAMLLKATYWNAKTREGLFRKHPPTWILPLTWRPAFLEEERGSSPLMDVMWVVWQEDSDGDTRFSPLLRPRFSITKDSPSGNDLARNYLQLLGF